MTTVVCVACVGVGVGVGVWMWRVCVHMWTCVHGRAHVFVLGCVHVLHVCVRLRARVHRTVGAETMSIHLCVI